jgi:hypothetical protein
VVAPHRTRLYKLAYLSQFARPLSWGVVDEHKNPQLREVHLNLEANLVASATLHQVHSSQPNESLIESVVHLLHSDYWLALPIL